MVRGCAGVSYEYRRFGSQVNLAFVAPGQAELVVPPQPLPLQRILQNVADPWVRAAAGAYVEPATGQPYGTLWAGGNRHQDQPAQWPVLVAAADGYRLDAASRGDYGGARFALGAGPLLVQEGRPLDPAAAIRAGGYTGFSAAARTAQAGVGLRPDGLLVHLVADALTLDQLARIFVELGCTAAMRLGAPGGPVYEHGQLRHGAEGPLAPCALLVRQEEAPPFLLRHLIGTQEPYRGSPILGPAVAVAEQMELYTHRANPAAPFYAALYLELGAELGVRGDLAYAQALLETNFFTYTGDVQAWQFNYGGLGARGGGAPGATFAGPREGVLAQLQHLYAYATAAPLPAGMPLADPRFDRVARGSAPRVGDLNGRWAVPGSSYGQQIDRHLDALLALAPAPVDPARGRATLAALVQRRAELHNTGRSDAPGHVSWHGTVLAAAGTPALAAPAPGAPPAGALPAAPVPGICSGVGGCYYQVLLPGGEPAWVPAAQVLARTAGAADAPVVLDPGHGGPDAGAVGADGTPEKGLNLALALAVQRRLEAAGVPVLLTRSGDAEVSLAARAALANQAGARLLLSLHHNAAGGGARGTETYVQGGEGVDPAVAAAGRRLGGLVHQALLGALAGSACPPVDRGVRVRLLASTDPRDYYFVLRHTHVPAVLAEVGFISHPQELACLREEPVRAALAAALAGALLAWLDGAQPPPLSLQTLFGL